MDKKLTNENLQTAGSSAKQEQKSANSLLIFLMAAILIFLIIGQFFLPITTIKYNNKTKNLSLTDFSLSEGFSFDEFVTNDMFFLTEKITMKQFLSSSNITLEKFFEDNQINAEALKSNVSQYKSAKSFELFADIKKSAFELDVPMSEYLLANHLTKEILLDTGEEATEEDIRLGKLTKTIMTVTLSDSQYALLKDNYFESGFFHSDGIDAFIVIFSVICSIASIALIIIAFRKKENSDKAYKFMGLSFLPILAAKLLACFGDILVKGEFSGQYGKYTNWTRFVMDLSPKDEVHISSVPIHIAPVLAISTIIPLVICIGMYVKNKLREK